MHMDIRHPAAPYGRRSPWNCVVLLTGCRATLGRTAPVLENGGRPDLHDRLLGAITLLSTETNFYSPCETRADADVSQTTVICATRRSNATAQRAIPVHRRTSFSALDDF